MPSALYFGECGGREDEQSGQAGAEYYNYYSYKTWGAAATYHLCVDSSVLGIDETVGYIEEFVRKKLKLYE